MRKFHLARVLATGVLIFLGTSLNISAQNEGKKGNQLNPDPHYKILHNFQGKPNALGGLEPFVVAGVVVDTKGTIYGQSVFGGDTVCYFFGSGLCIELGAEFKLDRQGVFTEFPNPYPFQDGNPEGATVGPMVLDAKGNLVFATVGSRAGTPFVTPGAVYTLNPNTGDFATLSSFSGEPIDGASPLFNVIKDKAGNLYGTTLSGTAGDVPIACGFGVGLSGGNGCGTVYKLDAITHRETVLHSFNFDDGSEPVGFALDSAGDLFGAALLGGGGNCREFGFLPIGCGVIFKIDASGNYSVVHQFQHTQTCPFITCPPSPLAPADAGPPPELQGWNPIFVTADGNGNVFGVTRNGGDFGLGVLYKIEPSGQYSVLHHFAGPGDGFLTNQIILKDHKLYGVNALGGNMLDCGFGTGCGTIFMVDTNTGQYSVLHTFSKIVEEGIEPSALAFDENGDLVGANQFGGQGVFDTTVCSGGAGCGNLFRLNLREHQHENEGGDRE